jgi:hypothetical protein
VSTAVAPCPRCDGAHPDPEAWLAPLRDGDAHRALEALVSQWLRPVKLPPLTHATLPQALAVLGPAIEPVLRFNHLREPMPNGDGRWRFAFENQGVWRASVDTTDRVTIDGTTAAGTLDEFLLGFVLLELSSGLPVQRLAEAGTRAAVGLRAVPMLAPWGELGYGGAQQFFVADGVIASAIDGAEWQINLGAACPRAMERAQKLLSSSFVVHADRRRRRPETAPWNLR